MTIRLLTEGKNFFPAYKEYRNKEIVSQVINLAVKLL